MDKENKDIDDEGYITITIYHHDEFLMLEHETEEEYKERISSIEIDTSGELEEWEKPLETILEDMFANIRLHGEHLLDKSHNPVIILGYISNDKFVDSLYDMSQCKGFSVLSGNCEFVQVLGKGCIKFSLELYSVVPRQKVVLLDYQTFYYYLKIACDFHINRFKEDEEIVKKHLKAYRENFNVIDEDIT